MKIQIKNWKTGEIIAEGNDLKEIVLENRADLYEANLREADLHGADLRRADLHRADLRRANLHRADLRRADLHRADLREADLHGADLRRADLHGADLREANLREANLHGADLREADLHGANLHGADLDHVYIHIKGSRFDLYCIGDQVRIGCEIHTIQEWEEKGLAIAKENNFTDKQIKEYKKYIEICKNINKDKI